MPAYPRIFSPLAVRSHVLPNRVIMPSMGTNLADVKGRVTRQLMDYYEARAAGRPGLLVVEAACVHPSGQVIERHFMNHDATALEGLKQLAQAIKGHQVTTVVQLFHAGRNAHPRLVGEPLAPSSLRGPIAKTTPRAMTLIEIEAMVDCFARAALRVMEAGFDGVEIHGGHEYLLHQFLIPYCNQRTDAYGKDAQGRYRFPCEVVKAVRQAIGEKAILAFRLSGEDYIKDGLHPGESAQVARLLESCGVNLFSVTGGVYETPHMVVPPLPGPPGTHLAAAEEIRRAVKVPVAAAGRFTKAGDVEAALDKVDLVVCGRAFLADPMWLQNAAAGREKDTRPCIGCNQGCIDRILMDLPVTCVANPWLGVEGEQNSLKPARNGITVAVVGGGLAGMEAARTLGELGHRVVLFEEQAQLGGQVLLAAVPPGKAEFGQLAEYYVHALGKLNDVEVRLNTEATVGKVCKLRPAVVVVAAGSVPLLPELPGMGKAPVVTARQVLEGKVEVGRRVAVLGGGNLGSEVAHDLAVKGHEVCIIELGLGIASDLGPARRYILRRELAEHKIRRYTRAKVRRLFPDRVSFLHIMPDGSRRPEDVGPVDTFVSAIGSKPRESLYLALEPKVESLFVIGDALSPARMGEATSEGLRVALKIHALAQEGKLTPPKC